jgi:catechol 2,3-dioxygenase
MKTAPSPPPAAATGSPTELLSVGPVELRVTDADRASRFWQQLIGLTPISEQDGVMALGADGQALIVLGETASRPAAAGHSGLYHVAVHFPSEIEFGRVLARLVAAQWPVSPVDHLFSKSIYLRDPDDITVELALETPWRMREMGVDPLRGLYAVDHDGRVHRPSEPLDVPALLAMVDSDALAAPADGAYIGHVHLSVPDLGAAVAFYRDQLEMVEHLNEPAVGFADLHAGGAFKHRIALNVFQGPDAPPAPVDMAGMDRYTIRYDTAERLLEVTARLRHAGAIGETHEGAGAQVHDPAGDAINLVAEAPVQ